MRFVFVSILLLILCSCSAKKVAKHELVSVDDMEDVRSDKSNTVYEDMSRHMLSVSLDSPEIIILESGQGLPADSCQRGQLTGIGGTRLIRINADKAVIGSSDTAESHAEHESQSDVSKKAHSESSVSDGHVADVAAVARAPNMTAFLICVACFAFMIIYFGRRKD